MPEFIIKRSENKQQWDVFEDGDFICQYPEGHKAGEVVSSIKEMYPDAKIGIKASDIGQAVARECKAQGYGDILWMK